MPKHTIQIIYYDDDDFFMDGLGWNMIDSGSIASRYPTLVDAINGAERMGLHYVVISKSIAMTAFSAESILSDAIKQLQEWATVTCSNCGKAVTASDGMHLHSMGYNCDGEGV